MSRHHPSNKQQGRRLTVNEIKEVMVHLYAYSATWLEPVTDDEYHSTPGSCPFRRRTGANDLFPQRNQNQQLRLR